ncbi:MAG: helix-turn-helix transcriptional regulator [Deltaproteobacteria bacterium]|nr:helix-turn-helix transcriptional regulator [Deltaproteobacteria bacterium]
MARRYNSIGGVQKMVTPREQLTEAEIRRHISNAGLGSLLRRLFYTKQAELARELGLTADQLHGLLSNRMDLNRGVAEKLGRILGQTPDVFREPPPPEPKWSKI